MIMTNKIIAIDYDGTIALDSYPHAGRPNWPVINKAKEEQAYGARLILWTCRVGDELAIAIEACAEWGLFFEAVNDNPLSRQILYGNNTRKVYADEYWDDHAVSTKFAEWVVPDEHYPDTCSNCKFEFVWDDEEDYVPKFCPECGTKMTGRRLLYK